MVKWVQYNYVAVYQKCSVVDVPTSERGKDKLKV